MRVRIAPSKRRILEMSNEVLIGNYSLIVHKASKLSSTQRKIVKELIEYRIQKGSIKREEVIAAVTDIAQAIHDGIQKFEESKKNEDSSSN